MWNIMFVNEWWSSEGLWLLRNTEIVKDSSCLGIVKKWRFLLVHMACTILCIDQITRNHWHSIPSSHQCFSSGKLLKHIILHTLITIGILSTLLYGARCVALCGAVWRCVALCGAVWRCVALCGAVWRCVALCGETVTLCSINNTSSRRRQQADGWLV